MPVIKQFDPAAGAGLNPTEIGVDATAGAARRVGAFYNQEANATAELGNMKAQTYRALGQDISSDIKAGGDAYLAYETHKEVSQGSATFAQLTADLTTKWNDVAKNTDPNDTSVAAKFNETYLQPSLDKFKSAFSTEDAQKWADSHSEALTQHMFQKVSADMSTMAGAAVVENVRKSANAWSNTAYSDPTSLPFLLEQADHSIGGIVSSSPNLSAGDAARVRNETLQKTKEAIVKSGIAGMITKNPNVDLDAVQQKYGDYINGAELKQFQAAAKTEAKKNTLVDKQIDETNRRQSEQTVRAGSTKIMTDNISFDPDTGHPIVDPKFFSQALDLARNNPDAPNASETVRAMFSWGESQQSKAAKVDDPQVKAALTDRMFDPENPTSRIDLMKAQADGKLSNSSFQSMNRLVTELEKSPLRGDIWKSTTAAVRDRLIRTDLPEGRDAIGAANYSNFMQNFLPTYIQKSRDGTLAPNALDLNDPKSMISQSLAPYKSSLQDRLRATAAQPAAAAAAPAAEQAKTEPAKPEAPYGLRGVAALSYSKSRNMWRDDATGDIYDAAGKKVSK